MEDASPEKIFPGNAVSYYFPDRLSDNRPGLLTRAEPLKATQTTILSGSELQFANNDSNDCKFTGKERDSETQLDYLGARYYGNWLGRFITPDWSQLIAPIPYSDLADPQTLNQYSYVRNIPTSRADPNGHCTVDGESHNFLWCIGHAMGLTHTQKEYQAIIETRRQWLLNNVATSTSQEKFLRSASNDEISNL